MATYLFRSLAPLQILFRTARYGRGVAGYKLGLFAVEWIAGLGGRCEKVALGDSMVVV